MYNITATSCLLNSPRYGGDWTYTQIHSFVESSDGFLPIGTLTFDRLGNLYGVTANGGNTTQCNSYGCGIVFELVRPRTNGGSWSEKIIYRFQPVPDANHPYSGVIFDDSGNLFGTTQQGGVNGAIYGGFGTVYELSPPKQASGSWTESLLYSFTGGNDGAGPSAAVTRDNYGNLFGTTITPTVFELSPPVENGSSWTEKTLHNFGAEGGSFAFAGLIFRSPFRAELYGATVYGGTGNNGTIYKIVP